MDDAQQQDGNGGHACWLFVLGQRGGDGDGGEQWDGRVDEVPFLCFLAVCARVAEENKKKMGESGGTGEWTKCFFVFSGCLC